VHRGHRLRRPNSEGISGEESVTARIVGANRYRLRVSESVPVRNSRLMNPCVVGNAGATVRPYPATCERCEIEFLVRAPATQKYHPKRCDPCLDHKPEGTTDEQLTAFREHHNRYLAEVAKPRRMTREAMAAKSARRASWPQIDNRSPPR
jgi:hypothetical protein